ncbi:hypothetical protein N7535_004476 [Penicillium sp. DV-2018c]|nr:hypothetical protein N7535_004476 [Penicillium sp. DV-2018c]
MNFQPWSIRVWATRSVLPSTRPNGCKLSTSTRTQYRPLDVLEDAALTTFQQRCFIPEYPAILPRGSFQDLPALNKWFKPANGKPTRNPIASLNVDYLHKHGAEAFVPLELTECPSLNPHTEPKGAKQLHSFRQFHAPLSLFLDWMRTAETTPTTPQSSRLYLAQCQLLDLPAVLRDDFPIPEVVARAGNGDVYDTNVWIGHPPTYTPLHRDPNPNLFVQLAGEKVVRLLAPVEGQAVFGAVRRELGKSGGREAAAFRGEEMMQGAERVLLDEMVWGSPVSAGSDAGVGFEARLGAGDGLFIPKGWWHSIKGVGEGVTGSVNWWFRGNPPISLPPNLFHHLLQPQNPPNSQPPTLQTMQVSRTFYRAALLNLTVSPFVRATLPATTSINPSTWTSATTHHPRLHSILFPQCQTALKTSESNLNLTHQQTRTMSDSASAPGPAAEKPDTKAQAQEQAQDQDTPRKEPLYLPAAGDADNIKFDMSGGGATVKLDHLGPMVVNADGTLSQIGNWKQMSDIERENTLRVLGKRNQKRLEALRAKENEVGGEGSA